jgi:hypothetical protein
MEFLLYSFLFILLYLFLGLGLTLLFCPESLRKHALFLAPMVGYCYLTLVGWYCYGLELRGTDAYALVIVFPPAIFLALALLVRRRQKEQSARVLDSELIAPVGVSIFVLVVISSPWIVRDNSLTSMSLGNNDIADYASVSRYLKEFARSDTTGFLRQTRIFKWIADETVFGAFISTSLPSSLFSLQTYQVQNMAIHIFFLFSILIVYVLAREPFSYSHHAATSIAALYGLSRIMLYTIYHGYESQIIATGLALSILLLNLDFIKNCRKLADSYSYVILAVLFNWGMSVTYPHMLAFTYVPFVAYLLFISVYDRSWGLLRRWIPFVMATIIMVLMLSPHRANALVSQFVRLGGAKHGWYHPLITPAASYGLAWHPVKLDQPASADSFSTILSILATMIIALGFANAYSKNRRLFILAASSVFPVLIGYTMLAFMDRIETGWGGYRSYKFLSFFLPQVLLGSLILFRNVEFTAENRILRPLPCLLIVLLMFNVYSCYRIVGEMSRYRKLVGKDMADLIRIESNPLVQSINIRGSDWWEIMWQTNFLMRKYLFFETTTYAGRIASRLEGQWDLRRVTKTAADVPLPASFDGEISVNSSYVLKRPERIGRLNPNVR